MIPPTLYLLLKTPIGPRPRLLVQVAVFFVVFVLTCYSLAVLAISTWPFAAFGGAWTSWLLMIATWCAAELLPLYAASILYDNVVRFIARWRARRMVD